MQAKVTEDGKAEEQLFDRFMCYCKTGGSDLSASISAAEAKTTQDTSSLEEAEALKIQLSTDLEGHQRDRVDAKDAAASATALRQKEAATFAKESSDMKTNIAALGKAIAAIEKGAFGSFLQTSAAAKLQQLTINMDMSSTDRDVLSAFLTNSGGQGYVPQSGEITGILKQLKDTMDKDLGETTANENRAIKDYSVLIAAKTKEINANSKAIESKTQRSGQVGLDIVNLKEDLDDTTKALLADRKFLANLGTSCAEKKAEWEQRSKTRSEELSALAETIRLLNDDDALELFKKTLPSPTLLEMRSSGRVLRQQALRVIRSAQAQKDPRMDLVMLALAGNSQSFDKVLKMIDEMVILLGKEQSDDDEKKAYCEAELDKTEDEKKELERTLADLAKESAHAQEMLDTLASELAALTAGIAALDKSVAEATVARKAENAEYKSSQAADKAAKELIQVAKNRLMQFYNPKLYVPPAKIELGEAQRIAVNLGSEEAPTVAPSGIAGTGITYLQDSQPVFAQVASHIAVAAGSHDLNAVAPPPPPETWDAYQKKGQEHNGVVAMIDMLIGDLDKDMTESGVEEQNGQAEYEVLMEDSRTKRAQDSKAVADKEGTKAELEARLQSMGEEHRLTSNQDYATAVTIKNLHLECDWLQSSFEARKAARAGEVDSLKKAKAVLSGADYSFVEQGSARVLRGTSQL